MNYKNLKGQFITKVIEDEKYVYFVTKENYLIRIDKFIPYCACYVGEYIDEITQNGNCYGIVTDVKEQIKGNQDEYYDSGNEIVYKGEITLFFENGKINMKVHGEDNGYYGVTFTMPVEVLRSDNNVKN